MTGRANFLQEYVLYYVHSNSIVFIQAQSCGNSILCKLDVCTASCNMSMAFIVAWNVI